jgi:hypothetical protein
MQAAARAAASAQRATGRARAGRRESSLMGFDFFRLPD